MANPSIQTWSKLVNQNSLNPSKLSEINIKLSAYYAYMTGQYIEAKFTYAEFYDEWKTDEEGKKRSDKMIDMMFLLSHDGKKYYALKKELRAYEILISTLKTAIIVAGNELKQNQYDNKTH